MVAVAYLNVRLADVLKTPYGVDILNFMTKVLLSSVFKPFGVDGLYSRQDSQIELFHNQLTKYQGVFSIRMHHLTYGLHVIANNLDNPVTVLEFPSIERFRRELRKGYDYVGIGAITPNFEKVRRMVREVRRLSPRSKIVLGGFCTTIDNIRERLDVDYVCVGEGISFMRELLGQPAEFTFRSPPMFHDVREFLGVPLLGAKAPHIPVGLGCPYGCDFCIPSHFFGKRHIAYFKTGRELYEEIVQQAKRYWTYMVCFMGDDNFLANPRRARELRDAVVAGNRNVHIFLFGTADCIERFGVEALAEMGACLIWIGRESSINPYEKNRDIDMADLIRRLHAHGIKVILSSILLLDGHTKENIDEDISDHIACQPDFSQFSFYSPAQGTPLYDRLKSEDRLLGGIAFEEMHAFKQPWFLHPHFTLEEAERVQEKAYLRDFNELGPSIVRWCEADITAYVNLKNSPSPALKRRAAAMRSSLSKTRIMLRAVELLAPTPFIRERTREVRSRIEAELGRLGLFGEAVAQGLRITGRLREWRTARFGDAIQPYTRIFHYGSRPPV